MDDLRSICYENSFLNQVIVRLDFLQNVSSKIVLDTDLENKIIQFFPRKGKDQIIRFNSIEVELNSNNDLAPNANKTSIEGIQREYYTSDEQNKVIISNLFMIFDIKKYSMFDEHEATFRDIIMAFQKKARIPVARTGIRYINIFDPVKIKIQKNYFSNEVAASFINKPNQSGESPQLIRSMHTKEYIIDSLKMNFRYGMFNPDYPNVLKKNAFVLDYDCFTDDTVESADQLMQIINQGHDAIQKLFEASISNSLRKVMNNE